MNISSIIGFLIFGAVMYSGVFLNTKTPDLFYDTHAMILVLGGTLAAAFVAYPYSSLSRTVDYLVWGLLFKRQKEYLKVSQDIASARNSYLGSQSFISAEDSHPFFREAATFLMNRNIDTKAVEEILRTRSEYFRKRYEEDAGILKSLAKYPPAFGAIGAVTVIIEIMQKLNTVPLSNLGHLGALAMVSVFWGVAISSFIILPLADSSLKATHEDSNMRELIIDGILLIRRKVNDEHFQAYLRGYLSVSDRSELKVYPSKINNIAGLNPYKKVGPSHVSGQQVPQQIPGVVESTPASEQLPTIETILGIPSSPRKEHPHLQVVDSAKADENVAAVAQQPEELEESMADIEVDSTPQMSAAPLTPEAAEPVAQAPTAENKEEVKRPTDLAEFDFKDARKLMSEVAKVAANKKYKQ